MGNTMPDTDRTAQIEVEQLQVSGKESPGTERKSGAGRFWLRNIVYLFIGILFGIVLVKGEVVSWYRIHEMFHFQSFFMFGIIGSAAAVGALSVLLIRAFKLRSFGREIIDLEGKPFNRVGNTAGGVIFGLGWALTGACPGPLYALFGAGYFGFVVAIAFALLGVVVYGYLKPRLPH